MTTAPNTRLHRVVLGVAILTAASLCAPALVMGLKTEDLVQMSLSQGTTRLINLFGGPSTRQQIYELKDNGMLPWITADDYSFGLWRPLASATHHLDYRLWPDHPVVMHLHSLLWFLAMIVGASILFRRLSSGPAAAAFATFFYAVDDAHGFAAGWLANRNALVAAAIAFPALIAHDRWRRDGFRPGGVIAGLLAWLSLQGGEIAVGVFGYAAAHVLFLDPAPWRKRWVPLVPWTIAGLAWAIPYRALGYGVRGSGVYIDPLASPLEFLRTASERLPKLLYAGLTGSPAQSARFEPHWILVFALVVLAMLGVAGSRWVSRDPRGRFWLAGMALAALPSCAMAPHDRLLFVAGAGGMAFAGEVSAEALGLAELASEWWRRAATTLAGGMLMLSNGVAAMLMLPTAAVEAQGPAAGMAALAVSAYGGLEPGKDLVFVNGIDFYGMSMMAVISMSGGIFPPPKTRMLYGGTDVVTVTRSAPNEIVLSAPHSFVPPGYNRVFRGASRPMHPGESLQLTGMRYVVERVDGEGMPTVVRFVFASPLDDGTRAFRWWNGFAFLPFSVPPVGGKALAGPFVG